MLGRAIAAPSFAALTSTELAGEGRLTSISVEAPGRSQHVQFANAVPVEASTALAEATRLRDVVERYAPEPASAPECAADTDCRTYECGCQSCLARHVSEPAPSACSPGHCVVSPCTTQARCDPAVHRCALLRPAIAQIERTSAPARGPCATDADCDIASLGCGCEPLLRSESHEPYVHPCPTSAPSCLDRAPYCDPARHECASRAVEH
jgi:hypothetical protein